MIDTPQGRPRWPRSRLRAVPGAQAAGRGHVNGVGVGLRCWDLIDDACALAVHSHPPFLQVRAGGAELLNWLPPRSAAEVSEALMAAALKLLSPEVSQMWAVHPLVPQILCGPCQPALYRVIMLPLPLHTPSPTPVCPHCSHLASHRWRMVPAPWSVLWPPKCCAACQMQCCRTCLPCCRYVGCGSGLCVGRTLWAVLQRKGLSGFAVSHMLAMHTLCIHPCNDLNSICCTLRRVVNGAGTGSHTSHGSHARNCLHCTPTQPCASAAYPAPARQLPGSWHRQATRS